MRRAHVSIAVPASLIALVEKKLLPRDQVVAANIIMNAYSVSAEEHPWVCAAVAVVLSNPDSGHSCVTLEMLASLPDVRDVADDSWPKQVDFWRDELAKAPTLVCVTGESNDVPFVLDDGDMLYSAKSRAEEVFVAAKLSRMLAEQRLQVITGGPGTGKTTSIAKRLVKRMNDPKSSNDTYALAAPTGLAAKRMKFALATALHSDHLGEPITDEIVARIMEIPKSTVHRLLKFNPSLRRQWGRHAQKTLEYNYVIIDEVSMMPLSMMARLLEALDDDTTLVLVGDKDQLASVDSGSVLADICKASDMGANFVEPLERQFRFTADSPVGQLSKAINSGDVPGLHAVLSSDYGNITDSDNQEVPRFRWINPETNKTGLSVVAREAISHARELCKMASEASSDDHMKKLLEFRDTFQVVCANRRGDLGVSGWNSTVDRELGNLARGQWYIGRPVIVLTNDYVNNLSNGDVGIVCADEDDQRFVVFDGENGIRRIPVSKLPPVATVHALTIHKSQGSEYGHTVVLLSTKLSRIVTRELVYTGITRTKTRLTLVATEAVLENAVNTPIRRATGLAQRLNLLLKGSHR